MLSYSNPTKFNKLARLLSPWCLIIAFALICIGLYLSLFLSPADIRHGESVRIMYVHVPSAMMGMGIYVLIAASSVVAVIWRHPLADIAAKSAALSGACFTLIALLTGSIWGKPGWNSWWEWGDPRLLFTLILFILYLGYIAIWQAIDDPNKAARIAAIVAIIGVINVPIIKFSVNIWRSIHQPSSFNIDGSSHIDSPLMLAALFTMLGGFIFLFIAVHLITIRTEIIKRKIRTALISVIGD